MTTIRISTPEEIAARAGEAIPFLRPPDRATVFSARATRLRQLAAGHAMRDYLIFVADVADAQQRMLDGDLSQPCPDAGSLTRAASTGTPPLSASEWPRAPAWRGVYRSLVASLQRRPGGGATAAVLGRLATAPDEWLDGQADRLLRGAPQGLDLGAVPLVAAALQVVWTDLLLRTLASGEGTIPAPIGRIEDPGVCPACASLPTASVIRVDGLHTGHRYLHCALCNLQWNMPRIACAHCGGTESIHYESLQPDAGHAQPATGAAEGTVRAECCGACGYYLKIVRMDQDAFADPVADDLASVPLDLLVSEAGRHRHGVNFMLLYGEADAPPDPGDS